MTILKLKQIWQVVKKAFAKFAASDPFNHSAAIAFYGIISIPAVLVISYAVAGLIYRPDLIQGEIYQQLTMAIGTEGADFLLEGMKSSKELGANQMAIAIGIVTMIFSATGVFIALQDSINAIWKVKPKPRNQLIKFMLNRLITFGMLVSFGLVLLALVLIDLVLALLDEFLASTFIPASVYLVTILNLIVPLLMVVLIFASFFKVLPDARVKWKEVWMGAFVTTLLFVLGKYLIAVYLSHSSMGSLYGATSTFVLILVWVYYSSMIILWGAAFTYIYVQHTGGQIEPATYAVKMECKEAQLSKNSLIQDQ